LLASTDVGVCFDDVGEFVREVIFSSTFALVVDAWTDGRRWDGKNGDDHPFRFGVFLVETHFCHVFTGNVSEHRQDFGRSNKFLLSLGVLKSANDSTGYVYPYILVVLFPRAVELETVLADDGLSVATSAMRSKCAYCVFDKWIVILSGRSGITDELGFGNIPHGGESGFRITITQRFDKLWIRLVDFEFATGETDTFEDLFRLIEKP
jgi:hypothetical protein